MRLVKVKKGNQKRFEIFPYLTCTQGGRLMLNRETPVLSYIFNQCQPGDGSSALYISGPVGQGSNESLMGFETFPDLMI